MQHTGSMSWVEQSLMRYYLGEDLHERIETFLAWFYSEARLHEVCHIDLPSYRRYFWKKNAQAFTVSRKIPDASTVAFIVRTPADPAPEGWHSIFRTSRIQILESRHRATLQPIRFGLAADEKEHAMRSARQSLEAFFDHHAPLSKKDFTDRFAQITDVDVALWVRGSLRGSQIICGKPLHEAIAEAAIRAARDRRFKPLHAEELDEARIEIVIMSDLKLPAPTSQIFPDKGYLLKQDGKHGWYMPQVLNALRFKSARDFFSRLAREKAGAPELEQHAEILMFEVVDFIEGANDSIVSLSGPMPTAGPLEKAAVIESLDAAARWLCRVQKKDGSMPAIIDPLTGEEKEIHLVRFAFTAYSLAEYANARNTNVKNTAEKAHRFLLNQKSADPLLLAYIGKLSLALGGSAAPIIARLPDVETIMKAGVFTAEHVAGLLLSSSDSKARSKGLDLAKRLRVSFELEKRKGEIIKWSELANVTHQIDPAYAAEIMNWLKKGQKDDGSFTETYQSDLPYTRAAGKIFEVLALDPIGNTDAIEKALMWLMRMQYTDDSAYFVKDEIRPKILGGFRHDMFNQEAWIDAAGHFLLGGARLLKSDYFN